MRVCIVSLCLIAYIAGITIHLQLRFAVQKAKPPTTSSSVHLTRPQMEQQVLS